MEMLLIVAKDTEETIKVLNPFQNDRKILFINEIRILRLNTKFGDDPVENGIVRLIIECGNAL